MREVAEGNKTTGRLVRWGGSARSDHPDDWYWTVSSGEGGKVSEIPAGNWPGGPRQFVGDTGGVYPKSRGGGSDGGGDENPPGGDPCVAVAYLGDAVQPDVCGGGGEGGPRGGEEEPPPVEEPPPIIELTGYGPDGSCEPTLQAMKVA